MTLDISENIIKIIKKSIDENFKFLEDIVASKNLQDNEIFISISNYA